MYDEVRENATRLLRAARDIHVERHGGNAESFTPRTMLELGEGGNAPAWPRGTASITRPSSGWRTTAR